MEGGNTLVLYLSAYRQTGQLGPTQFKYLSPLSVDGGLGSSEGIEQANGMPPLNLFCTAAHYPDDDKDYYGIDEDEEDEV